ncbi:MAG TPA: hypothetical protein PK760_08165 [Flavobacteriales bacterium]|nr:hypothetical protein [Flavobacteriales bacterium]
MNTLLNISVIACTALFLGSCTPEEQDPPSTTTCTTTCQNGGTVTSSCGCNCPPHFHGSNCQYQDAPTRFIVTSIKLTSWPTHPNGGGNWDSGNGRPDIYFRFLYSTTIVHAQTGYIQDCIPGNSYTYTNPGFPFYLDTGRTYPLEIFDDDGNVDQLMLTTGIDVANYEQGLHTTLSVQSGSFHFQFNGYWQF